MIPSQTVERTAEEGRLASSFYEANFTLSQYASKFGKCSSVQRTGKCQFSFQFQRKAIPKNVPATTQVYSSQTLAK